MYFVISELPNLLSNVAKNAYLNIPHWNIFLSNLYSFCHIYLINFFWWSLQAFSFTYVSTGHIHFPNDKIRIPGSLTSPLQCFSVVECQKSALWKTDLKLVVSHHTRISAWVRNPHSSQNLLVQKLIAAFLTFISCIQAVKFAHGGWFVWTNRDKPIGTHTHTQSFVIQVCGKLHLV